MEMKVDQSNNSEINNFDGFHDQIEELSGEEGEGEEEDKLNISSMSILAPFSESVAAVIKSPVRKMMVSYSTKLETKWGGNAKHTKCNNLSAI
jgi:hypothetical protein